MRNDRKATAVSVVCLGCCPAAEWPWFRWVLASQPLLALALHGLDRMGWLQ